MSSELWLLYYNKPTAENNLLQWYTNYSGCLMHTFTHTHIRMCILITKRALSVTTKLYLFQQARETCEQLEHKV